MESLRTRSAAHPSRVYVSSEDVSDAVAAGRLPGTSEKSPAGKGKGKRAEDRAKPAAATGLNLVGDGR